MPFLGDMSVSWRVSDMIYPSIDFKAVVPGFTSFITFEQKSGSSKKSLQLSCGKIRNFSACRRPDHQQVIKEKDNAHFKKSHFLIQLRRKEFTSEMVLIWIKPSNSKCETSDLLMVTQPVMLFSEVMPLWFFDEPSLGGGFNPLEKKKCQNGNLPQIGVKIKKFWNHHLDKALLKWMIWRPATIFWKHPFHLSYPNNLDHTNRTGSHLGRSSVRSMYPAVGDTIHKRIRRLAATTKRPGS